jgi:hypothetical protein
VEMSVKLGPVPVFRYRHRALERWAAGRFSSLETTTDSNGKLERVSARRTDKGLSLETAKGLVPMPANALPFTHWNSQVYGTPLFNPQEGKLLRVTAVRKGDSPAKLANGKITNATLWSIRGETEIDDWYDPSGVWTALRGKLKDGSMLEYRRV